MSNEFRVTVGDIIHSKKEQNMIVRAKSSKQLMADTDKARAEADRKLADLERRGVAAGIPRTFFSKIRQERTLSSQSATETPTRMPDARNGTQNRTPDFGAYKTTNLDLGQAERPVLTAEQEESDASIAREMARLEGLNLATCQQIVAKGRGTVPGQKAGPGLTPGQADMLARAKASIRDRDGK